MFQIGYFGGFLPCTGGYIRNRNNSETSLLLFVIYKSKSNPKIANLLKSPILSLNKLVHSDAKHFEDLFSKNEKAWEVALRNNFFAEQKNLIFEDLKKCSKSAWVLPWAKASKISSSSRKRGLHLDVGKETHFTVDTILTL